MFASSPLATSQLVIDRLMAARSYRPSGSGAVSRCWQQMHCLTRCPLLLIFLVLWSLTGLAQAQVPQILSAAPGDSEVRLSWSAVPGATSYTVKRWASSLSGTPTEVAANIAGTSTTDNSGISNGASYFYTVSAVGAGLPGGDSLPWEVWMVPPPATLSATEEAAQIKLSWPQVPGAQHYLLYRSTTSNSYSGVTPVVVAGTSFLGNTASYTDTDVEDETDYFYSVQAVDNNGQSDFSPEVNAVTLQAPAPTPEPTEEPDAILPADPPLPAPGTDPQRGSDPVRGFYEDTFENEGDQYEIEISLTSQQLLLVSALDQAKVSVEVLNSANQSLFSSKTLIEGSTTPASRPVKIRITALTNDDYHWIFHTLKVTKSRLFDLGEQPEEVQGEENEEPVTDNPIQSSQFSLDGAIECEPGYGAVHTIPIRLRAGEWLTLKSGIIYTSSLGTSDAEVYLEGHGIGYFGRERMLSSYIPIRVEDYYSFNEPYPLGFQTIWAPVEGTYNIQIAASTGGPAGSVYYDLHFEKSYRPPAPFKDNRAQDPNGSQSTTPEEGALPCPTCGVGGEAGPSTGEPVDLFSGKEVYQPEDDLYIYNPSGPNIRWARHYSNEQAGSLYSSGGLPVGWYHPYDIRLKSLSPGGEYDPWPDLEIVFPNGVKEVWKPQQSQDNNGHWNPHTGSNGKVLFTLPVGSPYVVSAAPVSTNGRAYTNISITWATGTVWGFTVAPTDNTQGFLSSISAATATSSSPQQLNFNWRWDDRNEYRLVSVVNASDNRKMLALTYSGNDSDGYLLTDAYDLYGRHIHYTNNTMGGAAFSPEKPVAPVLQSVSRVDSSGTRAAFTYQNLYGAPMLSSIMVPHPNNVNQTASTSLFYNTNGTVQKVTDGNGNTTRYTYTNNYSTKVERLNSSNVVETYHDVKFDGMGRKTGITDALGHQTTIGYTDSNNPDRVTNIQDQMGRGTQFTYEDNPYGRVKTITDSYGVVTTYNWDYNTNPFGRLTSIARSRNSYIYNSETEEYETQTETQTLATLTYVTGRPLANLVQTVETQHPNAGASTWTGPETVLSAYTYNEYGDVTSVSGPGHNGFGTLTTLIDYETDGALDRDARRGQPLRVIDPTNPDSPVTLTGLRYTKRGALRSSRDALGHTYTATYNLADQIVQSTLPATGQTGTGQGHTNYSYTYLGGPLKTTALYDEGNHSDPIRSVTTLYDGEARSLGTDSGTSANPKQVSTEPVNVTYTSFGALKTLSDGKGNQTRYDYDLLGRLTKIVRPGADESTNADVVRFYYNDAPGQDGSLKQQINGRGIITDYAYNTQTGDLIGIVYPASPGENVSVSYDAWGRPSSLTDGAGTYSATYSDADAVVSSTTTYKKADGTPMPAFTLATLYHADGLRAALAGLSNTASAGVSFSYGYDSQGRLTSLTNAQNQTSTWSYKKNGWMKGQVTAKPTATGTTNILEKSWGQNALGQLTMLANLSSSGAQTNFGGPDATNKLLYDGAGNLTRETAFLGNGQAGTGTTSYSYDGNDRVTGETSSRWSNRTQSYGYDDAYNRTGTTGSHHIGTPNVLSWTETITSNLKNQITGRILSRSDGSTVNTTYSYDNEGNRTGYTFTPSQGTNQAQNYTYDSNDHLIQVTQQNGTDAPVVKMTAGYRADGLRAWKQNAQGRTYFFYDGLGVLAEMNETGALTSVSTYGADGLVSKRVQTQDGPKTRFYTFDPRGNLATRTDENGVVTDRPSSSAYAGSSIAHESVATFAGYAGGYYDEETGFILFGQRYYDQSTGTWLTRDPIAENGGINLYSYVQGNPTNSVDPDGLHPDDADSDIWEQVRRRAGPVNGRYFGPINATWDIWRPESEPTWGHTWNNHGGTADVRAKQADRARSPKTKWKGKERIFYWTDQGNFRGSKCEGGHTNSDVARHLRDKFLEYVKENPETWDQNDSITLPLERGWADVAYAVVPGQKEIAWVDATQVTFVLAKDKRNPGKLFRTVIPIR
jgi:RHS repeat-associated protein